MSISKLLMPTNRGLIKSGVDRREMIFGMAAVGGAAAIFGGVNPAKVSAGTPRHGGTLRVGMASGQTSDSLDPATYNNEFTIMMAYTIHDQITQIDERGELVPDLCEMWDSSDNATKWRFKVRSGVEFHNGKALTVADMIASLNHHRGESNSAANPLLASIVDLRAEGDYMIAELSSPYADFPFILSDFHLCILPSTDGAVDPSSGIGAGPFTIDSFEPGVEANYKRFGNYWQGDGPYFDGVKVLTIADGFARQSALQSGAVDAIGGVSPKNASLLGRKEDINIWEAVGTGHFTAPMRTDTAPFDNLDIRKAIKHAVDRERILSLVLNGRGNLGNDHPISVANRYHASDLEQTTYDPDKSKWHLRQAGLEQLDVQLSASDAAYSGAVDTAVLYSEFAKQAGINIEVIQEPSDGYWSSVWMKKPWCMCNWGGRPTEDWMFSSVYAEDAKWNDTFWGHDRFNELLLMARAETNDALRREMYTEMQSILNTDGGAVVFAFNSWLFATSSSLESGGKPSGQWDLDGLKIAERWWFKA
ncbi:MAG: ABC transporter substrate-binding protein [Alphaproteobacteria bacterium]